MKNKSEIIVMLMPHPDKRISEAWGNGYLFIPVEHPAIIEWEEKKNARALAAESVENDWIYDDWYHDRYFSLSEMRQEITFTEYKELNGQKYVEIGFDTCHSHNHAGHDMAYVMAETLKLKAVVENYKGGE